MAAPPGETFVVPPLGPLIIAPPSPSVEVTVLDSTIRFVPERNTVSPSITVLPPGETVSPLITKTEEAEAYAVWILPPMVTSCSPAGKATDEITWPPGRVVADPVSWLEGPRVEVSPFAATATPEPEGRPE
jgi:hypothetical protein